MSEARYPPPRVAWYMVALLTVAYVLSFVDRYILGLLVEPIKADLGISDTQMGWLLGPAFAIFYATMGLPLGWMADRYRRTWIVGAGVALWSAATAFCGLARSYWQLFLGRMGVGVGEASLSPCAMSMISDSFPPERRGKPVALYTAALSFGAGIASLVSATVLIWAKSVPDIELPWIGVVAPWQFTFLVLGMPGLALALLFLVLREPPRQKVLALEGDGGASFGDMLRYVGRHFGVYASLIAFVCMMTIVAYSQGWLAALFQRNWGWPAERYAIVNGVLLLAIGPATVSASGWLSDRLYARGLPDAPLVITLAGAFVMIPTAVAAPLMPDPVSAFALFGLNMVGIAMISATGITALLNITPGKIRGQTVALYYMVISLAGLFLGPLPIGFLTDNVFGADGLRYALALLPLALGLPVLALTPYTRRVYRREVERRAALAQAAAP